MRKFLSALLVFGLIGEAALARPAVDAVDGRPPANPGKNERCTTDGLHCIRAETYVADVCRTIERAASREGLDKNFLARLIWKESRFEPSAVSHAGAEGIAHSPNATARSTAGLASSTTRACLRTPDASRARAGHSQTWTSTRRSPRRRPSTVTVTCRQSGCRHRLSFTRPGSALTRLRSLASCSFGRRLGRTKGPGFSSTAF